MMIFDFTVNGKRWWNKDLLLELLVMDPPSPQWHNSHLFNGSLKSLSHFSGSLSSVVVRIFPSISFVTHFSDVGPLLRQSVFHGHWHAKSLSQCFFVMKACLFQFGSVNCHPLTLLHKSPTQQLLLACQHGCQDLFMWWILFILEHMDLLQCMWMSLVEEHPTTEEIGHSVWMDLSIGLLSFGVLWPLLLSILMTWCRHFRRCQLHKLSMNLCLWVLCLLQQPVCIQNPILGQNFSGGLTTLECTSGSACTGIPAFFMNCLKNE